MIVSFSGIDGSGKSTLSEYFTKSILKKGIDAELCRPKYFANNVLKLYCAKNFGDPYSYIPNLNPDLYINALLIDWLDFLQTKLINNENKILICDRYIFDVIAQAIHYDANFGLIIENFLDKFPIPCLSYFLKINPYDANKRLLYRKEPLIHNLESIENLNILSSAYDKIFKLINWNPVLLNSIDINKNEILQNILLKYNELETNRTKIELATHKLLIINM